MLFGAMLTRIACSIFSLLQNSVHCMEPENLFLCSHEPTIVPCNEPEE